MRREDRTGEAPVPRSVAGGTVLLSSAGRGWTGVEALTARYPGGRAEGPAFEAPVVYVSLGPPLEFEAAVGGKAHRGRGGAGSASVVPAGLACEWRWRGMGELENLHLYLRPGFLESVAETAGVGRPEAAELAWRFDARDPQLSRIGQQFLSEMETDGLGGELYAGALATQLAVRLLREHSSLGGRDKRAVGRGPRPGGLSASQLKKAVDFIGDNLASGGLSLAGISAQTNLSPHHFSKLFKESTGLPPHRYVIRERVERAKGLLLTTDLPVGEIALSCGFAHHQHLARHFGRLVGSTPAAFRRESSR